MNATVKRYSSILRSMITQVSLSLMDLVAPRQCFMCDSLLVDHSNSTKYWCPSCWNSLPVAPDSLEILDSLRTFFPGDELFLSDAFALFSIPDTNVCAPNIMHLIHPLKYQRFPDIGVLLGRELAKTYIYIKSLDIDGVIAVPSNTIRRRERGYNQAERIASGFSQVSGIPLLETSVIRFRNTVSQTSLSAQDRLTNVRGSFLVDSIEHIHSKKLLLIDDVITTGATVNNLALTLIESGAKRIDVAAIVKA